MNKNKKLMLLGGIILITIAMLLILIPMVTGSGSVQTTTTTTAISTKTGREKKIDLSGYDRQVNLEDVKKKKPAPVSQGETTVTFSDSLQLYQEFVTMPDIPQLPEPEIYIQEKDGTLRRLQKNGNTTTSTTTVIATATVKPKNTNRTAPRPEASAVVTSEREQGHAPPPPANSLDALSAALAAESEISRNPETATGTGTATIAAVVHGEQKLKQGERVKLRTTAAGTLGGVAIPQNTYVYGTVGFGNNRITITISTAFINGRETAIAAQVYDYSDGAKGIYMQGISETGYITQQAGGNMGQEAAGVMASTGVIGRVAGSLIRTVTSSGGETEVILSNNHKVIIK